MALKQENESRQNGLKFARDLAVFLASLLVSRLFLRPIAPSRDRPSYLQASLSLS